MSRSRRRKTNPKLTTNEDLLSDDARFLIALIKSKKQEDAKQDILNEIANKSLNDQNKTIHEEKTKTEVLKIENTILKQLNTELRDKILLLNLLRTGLVDISTTNFVRHST